MYVDAYVSNLGDMERISFFYRYQDSLFLIKLAVCYSSDVYTFQANEPEQNKEQNQTPIRIVRDTYSVHKEMQIMLQ